MNGLRNLVIDILHVASSSGLISRGGDLLHSSLNSLFGVNYNRITGTKWITYACMQCSDVRFWLHD